MGAGHVTTLENKRFTFNEPGIYNLLSVPDQLVGGPREEVRIQVRMERYPDRAVDFAALHLPQEDLVQPLNVSVVTGIAIEVREWAERS